MPHDFSKTPDDQFTGIRFELMISMVRRIGSMIRKEDKIMSDLMDDWNALVEEENRRKEA